MRRSMDHPWPYGEFRYLATMIEERGTSERRRNGRREREREREKRCFVVKKIRHLFLFTLCAWSDEIDTENNRK